MVKQDVLPQNDDEDKRKKVLTVIVQVEDELEIAPKLEMQVLRAVQVVADVADVVVVVSSSGPGRPSCRSAADLSAVEQPPWCCNIWG
jgi:hypothetical protein